MSLVQQGHRPNQQLAVGHLLRCSSNFALLWHTPAPGMDGLHQSGDSGGAARQTGPQKKIQRPVVTTPISEMSSGQAFHESAGTRNPPRLFFLLSDGALDGGFQRDSIGSF